MQGFILVLEIEHFISSVVLQNILYKFHLFCRLYAVGGRDSSSCHRTVECYDPHTNKWLPCSPMATRRGGVGVGVVNGYLFALGGHDAPASNPSAPRFDSVERLVSEYWPSHLS